MNCCLDHIQIQHGGFLGISDLREESITKWLMADNPENNIIIFNKCSTCSLNVFLGKLF